MLWFVRPGSSSASASVESHPSFVGGVSKGRIPSRIKSGEDDDEESGEPPAQLDSVISMSNSPNVTQRALSSIEQMRIRIQKFMAATLFGKIYLNLFLFLSVFSCGQYIYQTYLTQDQEVRLINLVPNLIFI
jgi:hypothetical protein